MPDNHFNILFGLLCYRLISYTMLYISINKFIYFPLLIEGSSKSIKSLQFIIDFSVFLLTPQINAGSLTKASLDLKSASSSEDIRSMPFFPVLQVWVGSLQGHLQCVWPVITTVLGSLVLPGLMTPVIRDKAKPYLISSLTPAAPFIEKSLSISQGYSICHLAGGTDLFL